jgi:SAM-dependent methyltransferase
MRLASGLQLLHRVWLNVRFAGSSAYWEQRYRTGGSSGDGSYGDLAQFKADVVNAFVAERGARSVLELGCGDGNQLALARYESYVGIDVSARAIQLCRTRFAGDATKRFALYDEAALVAADCTLSLDVMFHLVEDAVYAKYLRDLFSASRDCVVVYSSNREQPTLRLREAPHVRHREFARDVARDFPEFELVRHVPNRFPDRSFAAFYLYARRAAAK